MNKALLGAALAALGCLAAADVAAETDKKQTRLRAGTPIGTFETWRWGTELRQASVEVRNVGEVEAKGVRVSVILPDGQVVVVHGPSSLAKNESATYSGGGWQQVVSTKKLRAEASCSNCRK
jgi:hypothetical protein